MRIFVKQPRATMATRAAAFTHTEALEVTNGEDERLSRDAALEVGPHAHVIVSRTGRLTFANLAARALFQISRDDVGRTFADMELAHRPVELRASVEQALRERRRVPVGEAAFTPERGDQRRLDVNVTPLLSAENVAIGVSVTFEDVSRYSALQAELEGNRRDLELAYEELQSTIDELETTNEELQSANEELQTTNEELQSTNEELETMNEELQSTNEELETINDELRERTGELNHVNEFLEAILTSLGLGVAVLDSHQRVQVWNRGAEDLWGLRADEAVEQHFLSLDIGLPSEQLASALRVVLNGGSERETRELEAINRRGRQIVCEATVLPLVGTAHGDGARLRGAIVMMEDRPREGE
jgi:two-component system CheB/CheR fusion protein